MYHIFCLLFGYFIGCFSPAAILSRRKKVDLKQEGTTNLGATNTALVLGTRFGVVVMVMDILKGIIACVTAELLFPELDGAGLLAGLGCVVGHCFPVFLKFRGGKGLASYGGMVLAYSPKVFLVIVIPAVVLMAIFNTGVAVPVFAGLSFPVLVWLRGGTLSQILTAVAASTFLIGMHWGNLKKALAKKDYITTREFITRHLFGKK